MDVTVHFKEILEQMQKNLECSICLELLNCPISTKCEHQFCRFCITKFLQNKRSVPCPLCKKQITKRGFQERSDLVAVVNNLKLLIAAFEQDSGQKCSPTQGPQKCSRYTPDDFTESASGCNDQKNGEASISRQEEKSIKESCLNTVTKEITLKKLDHLNDSTNKQVRNFRPKTRSCSVKAKTIDEDPTIQEDRHENQWALELKEDKNTEGNFASSNHKKCAKEKNKEDNYDLLQYLEVGLCGANTNGSEQTRTLSKTAPITSGVTKHDAHSDENTCIKKITDKKSKSKQSLSNVKLNKSLPSRTSNILSSGKLSDTTPHIDHTLDKNVAELPMQQSETLTQQSCHSSDGSSLSSTLQLSKPMPPISWTYTKRMQQVFKAEGRVRNWVDTLPKANVSLQTKQVEIKALTTKEKINAKKRTKRSLSPAAPGSGGDDILTALDTETGFIVERPVTLLPRRKSIFKSHLEEKQEEGKVVEKDGTLNEEADPYEFRGLTPLETRRISKKGKGSKIVNKGDKQFPLDLKQRSTSEGHQSRENKRKDGCIYEKSAASSEQIEDVTQCLTSVGDGLTSVGDGNIRTKRDMLISKDINKRDMMTCKDINKRDMMISEDIKKVDIFITETYESFKSDGMDILKGGHESPGNSTQAYSVIKEQAEELTFQKSSDSPPVSLISNANECKSKEHSFFLQENDVELSDNIQASIFEESPATVQKEAPLETSGNKMTRVVDRCQLSEPSIDKNEQSVGQNILFVTDETCPIGSRSRQSSKPAQEPIPNKLAHQSNPSQAANEPIPNKRPKVCQAKGNESIKGPATYAKTGKRATMHRNKTLRFSDCDTLSQRSSNELNNLIHKISQAEDYQFIFSTQEAIQKMEQGKTLDSKDNYRIEVNTIDNDIVDAVNTIDNDIGDAVNTIDNDIGDAVNTIDNDNGDAVNTIDNDIVDVCDTRPRKSTLSSGHVVDLKSGALNMVNGSEAEITPTNSSGNYHKSIHFGVVEETPCVDELSDTAQQMTFAKESYCTDVTGHQTGLSESFRDKKLNYGHSAQNESIQMIQPENSSEEYTDRFKPIKTLPKLKGKQRFNLYKRPNFEQMIHVSPGQAGMLSFTGSPSTSVPNINTPSSTSQMLTGSKNQNVGNKLVFVNGSSRIEKNLINPSVSEFMEVESQPTENKTASNAKDELSTSNLNTSEIGSGSPLPAIYCSRPTIINKSVLSNSSETTNKSLDVAQLTLKSKEVSTLVPDLITLVPDLITLVPDQRLINKHLVLVPDTCIDDVNLRKSDDDISVAQAETVILDSVDLEESSSPGNSTVGLISERSLIVPDSCLEHSNKPETEKSETDTVTLETIAVMQSSKQKLESFKESTEVTGSEDTTNVRMTQSFVSETQSTVSPGRGLIQNEINQEASNQSMVIPEIGGKEMVADDGTNGTGIVQENLSELSSPSQSVFKIKNQQRNFNCKQEIVKDSLAIDCSESSGVISRSGSSAIDLKAKKNNKGNKNTVGEAAQQSISDMSTPTTKLKGYSALDHSISSRSNSSNLKRQLHHNSDLQSHHEQLPSNTNTYPNLAVNSAPAKHDSDDEDNVLIVRKSKRKCHSLDNTPLKPVAFHEKPKVQDINEDVAIIGETIAMEDLNTNTADLMDRDAPQHQVNKKVKDKLNIRNGISKCTNNVDKNGNGLLPLVHYASSPQDEEHLTQALIVNTCSNEAKRIRTSFTHGESGFKNSLQNNKSPLLASEISFPNNDSVNPDTDTSKCQILKSVNLDTDASTIQKLKTKRGLASKNTLQYLESLPKHPKGTLTALEKAALIKEVSKSVTDQESDIEIIDVDKDEVDTHESAVMEMPAVNKKSSKGRHVNSSITSLKCSKPVGEDLEKKKLEMELFGCATTESQVNSATNSTFGCATSESQVNSATTSTHRVDFYSETSGRRGMPDSNSTPEEEEVAISFDLGVDSFGEKDEDNPAKIEGDSSLNDGNRQKSVRQKVPSQDQVCLNCSIRSDGEIGGNISQPDSLPLTSSPLDGEADTDRLGNFDQSEIEARDDVIDEIANVTDDDDDDCSRIKKRSKRQQISSDSEVSVEGHNEPNGTSSSVISSQSETLTTQQQLALEGDLEKLHQEIAKYEAELGKQSLENLSLDPKSEEDEISILSLRKKNPDIFVVDDSPVANSKDEEDSNDLFLSPEQVPSPEPRKKPLRTKVQKTAPSQSSITEHILKQFQSPGGSVRTKKHLEFLPSVKPGFNKTNEASQSKPSNFKAHSKSVAMSQKKSEETAVQNFETKSFSHNARPGSPIISSQKSNRVQMSSIVENRCTLNTAESKKICMVASGFGREENLISLKFCEKFGATLVPTFTKDVTHVIMKPACGHELVCDRTLKFFQGLAHKCWVLAYSWLAQSLQAGKLLSETDYEIEGDTSGGESTNGAKHARLSQDHLFSDFCFACVGNSDEMPKKTLSDLLTVCGAVVVDDPIALITKLAKYKLIVRCSDSDAAPSPVELDMFNGLYRHMKLLTVMREWVLDSLGSYDLLPLAEYVLNTCDQIIVPF